MAEFDVGSHCHLANCKQLDFLPFLCDGCSFVFCLQHREKSSHHCSSLNKSIKDSSLSTSMITYSCSVSDCNSTELVSVICSLCEEQFCLNHRLPEDHNCCKLNTRKQLKTRVSETEKRPVEVKEIEIRKPKSAKSQKMAAKVALMKLKLHSKGDKSLPDSERLYFDVHALSLRSHSAPMFVSCKWTVGKAIDFFSHELSLLNENNKASSAKLRLCSANTGEVISADLLLQTVVEKQILFNGSSVVIARLNEDEQNFDMTL